MVDGTQIFVIFIEFHQNDFFEPKKTETGWDPKILDFHRVLKKWIWSRKCPQHAYEWSKWDGTRISVILVKIGEKDILVLSHTFPYIPTSTRPKPLKPHPEQVLSHTFPQIPAQKRPNPTPTHP